MFRAILAASVATASLVVFAVDSAVAVPESVVAIGIPRADRAEPRGAEVLGETASLGVVYRREEEPGPHLSTGTMTTVLRAQDGVETTLAGAVTAVHGDNALLSAATNGGPERMQRLPDGPIVDVVLPAGFRRVGANPDGLLLAAGGTGGDTLSLLPWSGGDPLPITGLGEGRTVFDQAASDDSGIVLNASWSDPGDTVYVDTSTRRAWPLNVHGRNWGLNDGVLVWMSIWRPTTVSTMPVPTETRPDPTPAAPVPVPGMFGTTGHEILRLLPVGDRVIVSRGRYLGPVVAMDSEGGATTLLEAGHDVHRSETGAILAVGGPDVSDQQVVLVDPATASTSELVRLPPVEARATGVAVDGNRVVVVDNSAEVGALSEVTVDLATGVPGEIVPLGEDIGHTTCHRPGSFGYCADVVVDGGATFWSDRYTATGWHLRGADGTMRHGKTWAGLPFAMTDGHVMFEANIGSKLLDLDADALTTDAYVDDLQDGVTYRSGVDTGPHGPRDSVVTRDLRTGRAAATSVPGCTTVSVTAVAGAWVRAGCDRADGTAGVVAYDLAGGRPPIDLGRGNDVLGNGFVVRRAADDSLTWTSLTEGAPDWQALGVARRDFGVVAASRGETPTVAWVGPDGQAQMAILPVETTVPPASPTGVEPPSAPVVSTTDDSHSATVSWESAPASEMVHDYQVRIDNDYWRQVPPDSRSYRFSGLASGADHTLSVRARNIAGDTVASVRTAALSPPSPATNVRVSVDALTSTATLTWDWIAQTRSEPLVGFDIFTDAPQPTRLGPDARSYTFVIEDRWWGEISIHSVGTKQISSALSNYLDVPGLDRVVPSANLDPLAPVGLADSVDLAVGGRDDRGLAGIDIRWRQSTLGARLGAWETFRTGVGPGTLKVSGLRPGSTYCFSVQALDHAGNTSPWTAQTCTSTVADDRALNPVGGWTRTAGTGYFAGSALQTSKRLAELRFADARADQVWLLATTCPRCGTVSLSNNGVYSRPMSLRSTARRDRILIRVPLAFRLSGRISIWKWSKAGKVIIDGIAMRAL